ncbi:hypothetical protein LTR56_024548 [Elasticomyces elasticus]|nr:hypothetical protein LTR56_024548 [Elasticomyces elasticus]KAK3647410.1 hypothetical protein LTR22_013841 [Elasticomyces elasticus]KAK4917689.1 hypothetical protein LTR49_014511 [Elasticomyces elasticus]KAK5742730.1 hypothetical protein LTS12_024149 [Elasticomyces elasticus]
MEATIQGKTLDDVYERLNGITQSQAELTCNVSELMNVLVDNMGSVKELVATQKETIGKRVKSAHDDPEPTSDAGVRLTDTYELLEMILLDDDLPMETVFFAQRVNKQFHSLIARSKGLQQKLFLQPMDLKPMDVSSVKGSINYDAPAREVRLNPLFAKESVYESLPMFVTRSLKELTDRNDKGTQRLQVLKPRVTTNPREYGYGREKFVVFNMRHVGEDRALRTLNISGKPLAEGSWRKMYLTQPPVKVQCKIEWETRPKKVADRTQMRPKRTLDQVMQAMYGDFADWSS